MRIGNRIVDDGLLNKYVSLIRKRYYAPNVDIGVTVPFLEEEREKLHMEILESVNADYGDEWDKELTKHVEKRVLGKLVKK